MPGSILAEVTSDNTAGGSILTAVFPVLIFIIVATILYLRFSRPHRRVPGRAVVAPGTVSHEVPDPDTARAAAVAAGLPTAAGGGAAEGATEPAGAAREAAAGATGAAKESAAKAAGAARESAAEDGPSNVSGRDGNPAQAGSTGQHDPAQDKAAQDEAADGTEAGE